MDWKGIIREIRLLAINIQTDRFYAIYFLVAIIAILWLLRTH